MSSCRLLSERVENACREYLNCQYKPLKYEELEKDKITLTKETDYFKVLDSEKKCILLTTYFILIVCFLRISLVLNSDKVEIVAESISGLSKQLNK